MPASIGERLRRVTVVRTGCQLEIAQAVLLAALEELETLPGMTEVKAQLARLEVQVDVLRGQVLDQFTAQ